MQRSFMKVLAVVLAAAFVLLSACTKDNSLNQRKPAIVNQNLVIQTADITKNALFFPVEIDGMLMEIIAVKTNNAVRTAFNACQVCYPSGKGYYVQVDKYLICQNCGKRYGMNRIETEVGGCNPIPILPANKTVTASTITISREYLVEAKAMFESMEEENQDEEDV